MTTREAQTQMGDNIKMDLQEVGGGCEDWMEWNSSFSTLSSAFYSQGFQPHLLTRNEL